jgi:integrase
LGNFVKPIEFKVIFELFKRLKVQKMAIQFRLRSKANKNVSIKVRVSINRENVFELNTGFTINPNDWSEPNQRPIPSNTKKRPTGNKDLETAFDEHQIFKQRLHENLDKLESYIFKEQNKDLGSNTLIDKFWLESKIIECFDRIEKTDTGLITNYIQDLIDNASTRKVKIKGGYRLGLSKSRINSYESTKNILIEYQKKIKKQVHFIDIDETFIDKMTNWLYKIETYATNTASKHIANIKTVCTEAERKGKIQVNPYAKNIVIFTESDEDRFIQTLSFDELETIRTTKLTSEAYNNARKWILLGCEFGQRGGDLMNITKENVRYKGDFLYLDITQQKTKKDVTIPIIAPHVIDIVENSFPYKISTQKLNLYIKKVCEIAKINAMTEGKIYDSKTKRKVLKFYEKHKLITSHSFRRSYCSNYYKKIATPILMAISGHQKESVFLKYINKPEDKDANADLFRALYEKLNEDKKPQMKLIKNDTKTA